MYENFLYFTQNTLKFDSIELQSEKKRVSHYIRLEKLRQEIYQMVTYMSFGIYTNKWFFK